MLLQNDIINKQRVFQSFCTEKIIFPCPIGPWLERFIALCLFSAGRERMIRDASGKKHCDRVIAVLIRLLKGFKNDDTLPNFT